MTTSSADELRFMPKDHGSLQQLPRGVRQDVRHAVHVADVTNFGRTRRPGVKSCSHRPLRSSPRRSEHIGRRASKYLSSPMCRTTLCDANLKGRSAK